MVADCCRASPQENGQPTGDVWMEIGSQKTIEKKGVANPIKGLREVCSGNHGAGWRLMLVEAARDHCGEGKKSGYGGAAWAEAMLEGGFGKGREEQGANKAIKDFRGGAKEGDRAVRGAKVEGFTRFGHREDEGVFPDSG